MTAHVPADAPAPSVRVDLLGPLQLTVGDVPVDVPGPKRRALLALLAVADGRAVRVDELLEALWPDELPESARATLQSHVSRLRGHLGAASTRLEGLSGAYRLRIDHDGHATDVAAARALLAAARDAPRPDGWRLLAEARSLWRGAPLAEFDDVDPLAARAVTLEELRFTVEEAFVAAALDAGAIGEGLEAAATLVRDRPFSEPAALLLMRALDASGRAADALRAGHDFRRRLATETGLEASPAVGDLERAIAGSTGNRVGRLPRPAGKLRGRDSELAALQRLLAHERLVTVLGPGGVGKTRLVAEIALRAEDATVLLLASVTDQSEIPHALAAALDLQVVHGDVLAACAALLAAGEQLLFVDNCEHLLPGVRDVVATLLDGCPRLSVLATSREPLGLAHEQRLRIAPLPVTPAHDLDGLDRSPAVALFVDRARGVRPDLATGPEDLRLVGEIVRRLDGVPLAIELAAGRLSSLTLGDLHDRLDRALDLLGDASAMTLRRALEWSYALLPDHEQRLFRHLGVFPDGFDLATAESVAVDLGLPADAAGALGHLVDTSMVEAALGAAPRYRMLDIMRSFAHDRLRADGEHDAASERFLQWALDLVTWADHAGQTSDEWRADRALRRELGNLRAAWRMIRVHHRLDDAVRIVRGIADFAGWREVTETWTWPLELADDPAIDTHPEATTVLGIAAGAAWGRGELERSQRLALRGLALGRDGVYTCESSLALVALSRGDFRAAIAHGSEAAAQATRTDQSLGVAALATAFRGDLDGAAALNARLAEVAVSPTIKGFSSYVAGEIDALAGRTDQAEEHYERAVALSRESGATFVEGIASVGLLTLRAAAGHVDEALAGYRHLIDYWDRTGGWTQQWATLRNLAVLLRSLGDEDTAVLLLAAAADAPDAPATNDPRHAPASEVLAAERVAELHAASTGRAGILATARHAIDRRLAPNG